MNGLSRRRALIAAALVIGAVVMFAGGAIAANATRDSNSGNKSATTPDIGTGPFLNKPSFDAPAPGAAGQAEDADGRAGLTILPAYCPGQLEGVVNGNTIDLTGRNFSLALLRDGFALSSITVAAVGDCDANGNATNVRISVDSSWVHTATGAQVWVNQREEPERQANVEYEGHATFWADGYSYSVSAGIYTIMPVAQDGPEPARDLAYQQASKEVIDAAIAQLAPNLDRQCFYRQAEGSWDDIVALGVGDPRSAIPSGYTESNIHVSTFVAPPASCDQPPLEDVGGVWFSAQFSQGDSNFIVIEGSSLPRGATGYMGQLAEWGVNWATDSFQFGVWAKTGEGGVGKDVILAIARALDPSFSEECLVQDIELSEADLEALGFRAPVAPDTYSIVSSSLRGTTLGEGCGDGSPEFQPSYNLSWSLKGEDGTTVDVYVNRYEGSRPSESMGWISDFGLNWTDAEGTSYSVNGHTIGVSPVPQKDVLIAIATSLDPTLDVDSLEEDKDGGIRGGAGASSPPSPPDAPASDQ